ncbi:hypothetical protein AKJ51_02285 [candidate division MSBL1 archaeon SCGC-AAA382A20]|uniref:PRC-barrel domain-containing protein n=1 Tax=candidate division MSBL1 archaeon SCGC-AAA382A20 TaxID=1698280 RepID=A0A133VKQ9_9EURY|nr:hypothetical protein AKJ51_02285 [candidate division MSBL1 archaeon SCGC-AAA382A20]
MPVNVKKLSQMFSKDVFTDRGEYCGKIKNVKVDLDKFRIGSIVLKAMKGSYLARILGGKKGVVIPYQFIKSIGDIVIIKHISSESVRGEEKEEAKVEETTGPETVEPEESSGSSETAEEEVSMPF